MHILPSEYSPKDGHMSLRVTSKLFTRPHRDMFMQTDSSVRPAHCYGMIRVGTNDKGSCSLVTTPAVRGVSLGGILYMGGWEVC